MCSIQQPGFLSICCSLDERGLSSESAGLFPFICQKHIPSILNKKISLTVSFLVRWEASHTLKGLQASAAKSNIKKGRS